MKRELKLRLKALKGRTLKRILGNRTLAVIAKTSFGMFAVDPEDLDVGGSLLKNGSWGNDEIALLKKYLTPKSTVLIVGAHIGSLAIPLSRLCGRIIAIEANPNSYELLKINLALNSVFNCQTLCIAASDKKEALEFLLSRVNSGGSKRVPKVKKSIYYYDNPRAIVVEAVSLDDYLEEDSFDLIVMDIEGSEYFALKGMQNILSKAKVIQVEFLPHHLKNVSGVSVREFLSLIEPHFSTLIIPSKKAKIGQSQFETVLTAMYHNDEGDDGIIFEKN
jgi:FkbM family methyltransferase